MTELMIWVFFALVQAEGMQLYGFSEQSVCHQKLEEVRQTAAADNVIVMSRECMQVKMEKP